MGNLKYSILIDKYSDQEKMSNPPLHKILECLAQHPLSKLVIVVTEKDTKLAGLKKQYLNQAVLDLGIALDQVTIRDWQEKDAKMTWYGDEDFGVLMRLL